MGTIWKCLKNIGQLFSTHSFYISISDIESFVESFYRPHKMALWNHLVPDLVQLGVQERETDKLPHSRYPSSPPAENEYDSYQTDKKQSARDQAPHTGSDGGGGGGAGRPDRKPTSTMGRERIAEVCI